MSVTAEVMGSQVLHTVRDYGDQALLLEFDTTADVLAWTEAISNAGLLGVLDVVPASRTVLIKLAGPRYQAPTRQRLKKLTVTPPAPGVADRVDVTLEVVYEGPDLDDVARLTGLTADEVIAAHGEEVARFKAGEVKLTGFFVGQVMKRSGGKADPKAIQPLLMERLK